MCFYNEVLPLNCRRVLNDMLELTEVSMDSNLEDNQVRTLSQLSVGETLHYHLLFSCAFDDEGWWGLKGDWFLCAWLQVRIIFRDSPIVSPVSIHETEESVIILVVTVSSVNRFVFTHPNKIYSDVSSSFLSPTLLDLSHPLNTYYLH